MTEIVYDGHSLKLVYQILVFKSLTKKKVDKNNNKRDLIYILTTLENNRHNLRTRSRRVPFYIHVEYFHYLTE